MRRLFVFVVGVMFVGGLSFLTLRMLANQGITAVSIVRAAVSLLLLALIVVGIVGALRNPP
jgi:hypothetical protein